jgi:hypothetical protein
VALTVKSIHPTVRRSTYRANPRGEYRKLDFGLGRRQEPAAKRQPGTLAKTVTLGLFQKPTFPAWLRLIRGAAEPRVDRLYELATLCRS